MLLSSSYQKVRWDGCCESWGFPTTPTGMPTSATRKWLETGWRRSFRRSARKPSVADTFIEFLERLMHNKHALFFLIADGYPVLRSERVKQFVAGTKGKLCLFHLPPYSSVLNPDELIRNHLNGIGDRQNGNKRPGLSQEFGHQLHALVAKTPALVRSLFQHLSIRYAAKHHSRLLCFAIVNKPRFSEPDIHC